MISIEKVTNGYILRIEETEEDSTLVCQKEFGSMNMALGAVFKELMLRWQEESESVQIKLDVVP